jgi:exopolysaccharide production protein ExoQ
VFSAFKLKQQTPDLLVIWVVILLFSGQGFRNMIGLVGYSILTVATVAAIFYVFWDRKAFLRTPPLLNAFLLIATGTTIWSAYRTESILATIILLATTTTAVLITNRYTWRQLISLLTYGLQATLVLSILFELVVAVIIRQPILPLFNEFVTAADVQSNSGALYWSNNLLLQGGPIQGFMGNRNLLGFVALLTAVTTIIRVLEKQTSRTHAVIWLVIALIVHALTISATISLAFIAVIVIILGATIIRKLPESYKRPGSWVFVTATITAGVLALKNYDLVFRFLDREPNLTSRTAIWDEVIKLALQRPEGWGWVSYWPVWTEPFNQIPHIGGLPVSHAHNAFLDVWLQTGVVGVVVLMLATLLILSSNWRSIEHSNRTSSWLPVGLFLLITCLMVQAMTESRLLLEGNWWLFTILFMYTPQLFQKKPVVEEKADRPHHDNRKANTTTVP